MKRATIRLLVCAAALTAAAVTAAGCAKKEPPLPAALTAAQTVAEYRAEAANLQLSAGWMWPGNPIPANAPDGDANVYEPGFGKQAADHYWFCSWTARTLDATLSPADHQAALAHVLAVKQTFYYTTALVPDSRTYLDTELQDAQLGDFGLLKNDFMLNCPQTTDGS